MKHCKICQKPFEPSNRRHVHCKECGSRKAIDRRAKLKRYGPNKFPYVHCIVCGQGFTRIIKRKVTCSKECSRFWEIYMSVYGLSLVQYNDLKARANGCCEMCTKPTPKLFVDHNHETGKVRGLLCITCNTRLGYFESTTEERVSRMLDYLHKYNKDSLSTSQTNIKLRSSYGVDINNPIDQTQNPCYTNGVTQ